MQISLIKGRGHGFHVLIVKDAAAKEMKLGDFLENPAYKKVKFDNNNIELVKAAMENATHGFKIGLKQNMDEMINRNN